MAVDRLGIFESGASEICFQHAASLAQSLRPCSPDQLDEAFMGYWRTMLTAAAQGKVAEETVGAANDALRLAISRCSR